MVELVFSVLNVPQARARPSPLSRCTYLAQRQKGANNDNYFRSYVIENLNCF